MYGTDGTEGTVATEVAEVAEVAEAIKGRAFSDGLQSKIRFRHAVILITMLKP